MAWDEANPIHREIIAYVRRNKKHSAKYNLNKDGVMSLSENKRSAILGKYNATQAAEFVRHKLSLYITDDANNLNVICATIFFNEESTARNMAASLMDEMSYQYVFRFKDDTPSDMDTNHIDLLNWDSYRGEL